MATISEDDLVADVSVTDLAEAGVYPEGAWRDDENLSYATRTYARLATFFQEAARDGDGMLMAKLAVNNTRRLDGTPCGSVCRLLGTGRRSRRRRARRRGPP
jgi:Domain of unknown function (DUF1877)